ncbi:3-keto-steroid reductase/17-beta-hydroxysteroid dehydrogenase 7-like [Patiria miniata]|uniref:3-keto-steroid reductase/17-beta-hydroxysteroid dehydrogenase 7 n=1 Tax=Patiria miniata TaxID=46514 RepID=A0A914AK16_PATMI|nr:3-keto-steroid reductase/17-beta-hydroxysteroid dehydrogenase 7-like [Patiria miniata]
MSISFGAKMAEKEEKVVIITGANSGIGLSFADRLLTIDPTVVLCLACRNPSRADTAKKTLLATHPTARIDLVRLDTSDIKGIFETAKNIKRKYSRIDFLYLNAGIMPVTHLNWKHMFKSILTPLQLIDMLTTGEGLLNLQDDTTKDGLKSIFCTNLFGHFVLIQELEDLLCQSQSRIIWTSSSNADKMHFSLQDIQHKHGTQGYSSSKYAMDILNIALNEKYNNRGVFSHLISPGVVATNITSTFFPSWMWSVLYPVFLLVRVFAPRFVIEPSIGAESMVWVYGEDRISVRSDRKYTSYSSAIGNSYIVPEEIEYEPKEPMMLYNQLDKLHKMFQDKYNTSSNTGEQ